MYFALPSPGDLICEVVVRDTANGNSIVGVIQAKAGLAVMEMPKARIVPLQQFVQVEDDDLCMPVNVTCCGHTGHFCNPPDNTGDIYLKWEIDGQMLS